MQEEMIPNTIRLTVILNYSFPFTLCHSAYLQTIRRLSVLLIEGASKPS
jgi:hypothetical protein